MVVIAAPRRDREAEGNGHNQLRRPRRPLPGGPLDAWRCLSAHLEQRDRSDPRELHQGTGLADILRTQPERGPPGARMPERVDGPCETKKSPNYAASEIGLRSLLRTPGESEMRKLVFISHSPSPPSSHLDRLRHKK